MRSKAKGACWNTKVLDWLPKNRPSHYPQSRHFLDACDELGLMVLEEIPGWQHIGDASWKDLAVDNVRRMICCDWNHPSIILWGVRINESRDDHDFYTRTNALAHQLDPTRPTGGIRNFEKSELLEDAFTINDFGFPLRAPSHPLYLNTEFVGHTYLTKTIDNKERLAEHTLRHARVHNQLASNVQYAGCTTHISTSVPATGFVTTPWPTFSASPSPLRVSINRSATRKKTLCWSRPSAGRAATNPSDSARVLCAPTAITSSFSLMTSRSRSLIQTGMKQMEFTFAR